MVVPRTFRLLLAGAVAGVAVVAVAPAASAHAVLVSSDPASGSTVATPPSSVTLTFDESVGARAFVVVTGPDGARVDSGAAAVNGAKVTEQLKPGSAAGTYLISFRVVSDDGHPVESTLTYTVTGGASSSPSPSTSTAQASPSPAGTAPAQAAPPAASAPATQGADDTGSHWLHVLGGVAVVLAGAGALLYERLHRRRRT